MEHRWIMCFLVVPIISFWGCGKDESPYSETQAHVEAVSTSSVPDEVAMAAEAVPTSSVPDEVAMAVAEIERDFATIPSIVTNGVGAEAAAHQIGDKIVKLPPALSEQYGRKMAQTILSVPIDHFSYHTRIRSLVTMFWMMREVGWRGIKAEGVWDLRIMTLTRYRKAIEYAKKEKNDWRSERYIDFVSDDLNGYSEFWEETLAYRVSKSISPNRYACEAIMVPDEEYFAIRKRFEEFLGRPIRSYEEIVRARRERDRQMELERLGPIADDVKPNIEGL